MKYRTLTYSMLAALGLSTCMQSWASDARSIALGGSVIANGRGAHGALANPASMMAMQRRQETFHFRLSASGEVRDTGTALDLVTDEDNESIITDIEDEIDALDNQTVQCNPAIPNDPTPCVTGTENLSDIAGRLSDLLQAFDDETIDAQINGDLGLALTHKKYPIAFHLRASGTLAGRPNLGSEDIIYIEDFEQLLADGDITLQDIEDSPYMEVVLTDPGNPAAGGQLNIVQPEDVLAAEGTASAVMRTQLGVSLATTLELAGYDVDVGVTPKFSSLTAARLNASITDELGDNNDTPAFADRLEDTEVTESSFTFDVGGSMRLPQFPIQVAAVLKNVVPESISTEDGFKFRTDPQLIIGAAYQRGLFGFNGDIALNSAKVDGFETQKIALGVEFGTRLYAARAGISHDASRSKGSTALSLGFGLGPVELGGRISGEQSINLGMQVAFSFD